MNEEEKGKYYYKLRIGLTCKCGKTFFSHEDVHNHLFKNDKTHPSSHFDGLELSAFFKRLDMEWKLRNKVFNPSQRNSKIEINKGKIKVNR